MVINHLLINELNAPIYAVFQAHLKHYVDGSQLMIMVLTDQPGDLGFVILLESFDFLKPCLPNKFMDFKRCLFHSP